MITIERTQVADILTLDELLVGDTVHLADAGSCSNTFLVVKAYEGSTKWLLALDEARLTQHPRQDRCWVKVNVHMRVEKI